jgi:nitrous oxidase accessory protein NosD
MGTDSEATRGIDRRTALAALAAGGVATAASTGVGAAKPGKGAGNGPKKGGCDIAVPDDHATIQAAVDAADDGDTVCVADGTYAEQVVIDKSLTLRSAEGASPTIEPADAPRSFTIPESGPAWEPMVFAYGGTESGGDVSGADTVDVTVSGFTLDGRSEQPDARRKPAVLFRNASGAVSENTVENMGVGGKETFGILAYGDSAVTIADNAVSGYERGGIGANGDGGAHPAPAVRIRDNAVTGSDGLGEAWGPNGIQVGFGAGGQVQGNVVTDNRYSDEAPVAAGVLVFESDGVVVRDNRIENADIGLSVGSWGWLRQFADGNNLMKNHVRDAEYGALLEAVADPYDGALTGSDPSVSNNKVVNNHIKDDETTSDPDGNIGVGVLVEDAVDNEYAPTAKNNKVVRNTIAGFDESVVDEGSATKVGPFEP